MILDHLFHRVSIDGITIIRVFFTSGIISTIYLKKLEHTTIIFNFQKNQRKVQFVTTMGVTIMNNVAIGIILFQNKKYYSIFQVPEMDFFKEVSE